jgi:hypothetical protein
VTKTRRKRSLRGRILAVLGESDIPMATPDIVVLCAYGLTYPRNRVWVCLKRLLELGLVVRGRGVAPGRWPDRPLPVATWRLAR